jgi:hypothetical protein
MPEKLERQLRESFSQHHEVTIAFNLWFGELSAEEKQGFRALFWLVNSITDLIHCADNL